MCSRDESSMLPPRAAYISAGASLVVAALELRLLPIQGVLPGWGAWLIDKLLFSACAVFALLALRQHMRGRIHAKTIRASLLYLCVVYGAILLMSFVNQWAKAGVVSSPPESLWRMGMMALRVSAAASFAYAAFRFAQSDVAGARWLAAFAALAALYGLTSISSGWLMVSTGIAMSAAAYLILAVYFIRLGRAAAQVDARSTRPAIHACGRGVTTFTAIVGGIAATASAHFHMIGSLDLHGSRALDLTVVLLLAPVSRALDSWGLPALNPILLFMLSLPFLTVLLAPVGLRLILVWPGRLWGTVLLQVLFLLGYLLMSFALIIGGIQG